jgi:hypothetical protein
VRATSPPTARTVALAALAIAAASTALLADPSTAVAGRWLRPVPGELARPFSYSRAAPFAAGAHRGADLAAPPGTPVRAACAGSVLHAGRVALLGRVVSVRCGSRRVSYMPLAGLAVRAGQRVATGAPLGTVAAGHGGLHLGVRRAGDRFGYVDPLALLAPERPVAPRALPTRGPHGRPRAAPPVAAPVPAPAPVAASPRTRLPATVWLGLALALPALAGSGAIALRRRSATSTTAPVPGSNTMPPVLLAARGRPPPPRR